MMPLAETGAIGAAGTLAAAPVLGFAFGWCLERGGLGSARKLSGQFYFTDLTVFKVMFSALVTAMLGAFWLGRLGLLDLELVYVPETFALPQAIGGVLFGAGFLVSGLCPGTSCVAAAAGRLDGLGVIGGMLAGVLIFNLGFDWLEELYSATPWGAVTMSDLFGTTQGVMVGAVTFAALAAFVVAGRPFIASREQITVETTGRPLIPHRSLAVAAAVLSLAAVAVDLEAVDVRPIASAIENEQDHISAPDLARLIMNGDPQLHIFDLRSRAEFDRMHVPAATHASIETLSRERLPRSATIVLYSEGGAHAAQAWVLLRLRGYRHVFFLREGMFEWLARVMEPRLPIDATPDERAAFERAAEMSRFFGGLARAGVPRSEVPVGYWNSPAGGDAGATHAGGTSSSRSTNAIVERIRRRGC